MWNNSIKWANDYLISKGYSLQRSPEVVIKSPWSSVIRFLTSKEDVYLKITPPSLFLEPKIMQLLANQLHANVPTVTASNNELHCFLMKDAGQTLRKYLKTEFQPDLLSRAIKEFTTIQRSTENHIESFLALDVPDWRLEKLPKLYLLRFEFRCLSPLEFAYHQWRSPNLNDFVPDKINDSFQRSDADIKV